MSDQSTTGDPGQAEPGLDPSMGDAGPTSGGGTGDPGQAEPAGDPSMGDAGDTPGGGTGDADLSQPAGDPSMSGDQVDAGDPRESRG